MIIMKLKLTLRLGKWRYCHFVVLRENNFGTTMQPPGFAFEVIEEGHKHPCPQFF